jgi:hypothetical protein
MLPALPAAKHRQQRVARQGFPFLAGLDLGEATAGAGEVKDPLPRHGGEIPNLAKRYGTSA